jgi:uncharacterized surface anchored protein
MCTARSYAALLCLLLGACLLNAPYAWGQSGVSLRGTVLDASGGAIQGAPLALYSADRVRIISSDQHGNYEFTNLLPGTYELEVDSPPGFKRQKIQTIEINDKPPEAIYFKLEPGAGGGPCMVTEAKPTDIPPPKTVVSYEKRGDSTQVVGVVHSYQNDRPLLLLPSATVKLVLISKSGDPRVIESNEKGEFRFTGLEPGKYELLALHEGYHDLTPVLLWVARENLTRVSLDMVLRGKEHGC